MGITVSVSTIPIELSTKSYAGRWRVGYAQSMKPTTSIDRNAAPLTRCGLAYLIDSGFKVLGFRV